MAHIALGMGALGLTGAGGVYGYHLNQVRQRRSEIQSEEDGVRRRIREFESKLAEAERVHTNNKRRANEGREAALTLWEDRSERYGAVVKEREALIQAAPEGLGILQGIGEHFLFMTKILPTFHRYDAQAHRMNSLLVTLKVGEASGISTVAPVLRSAYEEDPFVRSISDNVIACAKTTDIPSDIHDLSASFAFCLDQLNESFEKAHGRLVTSRAVAEVPAPSLTVHAVQSFLNGFRANTEKKADVSPVELAQLESMRKEKQSLSSPADIRSALAYADELSRKYRNDEVLAKEATIIKERLAQGQQEDTTKGLPLLEATSTAEATRRGDITFDPQVVVAVKQLAMWRSTAVSFLLQQQSLSALKAYCTCLSDTLTDVHDDLPERLLEAPPTITA